ncbi:hypothetical protein FAZ69_02775 [Trinickia terrae]|uniref:Uncharacterized protein n=1 Tax=Trinickia terrae TaxID=2571161 RepID=A0A4U1IFT6_9BURK|nr:hypothetical protein [Trinickia terrae]TKC92609.1 hypothetical protein FAZ69_02775 [Trinickia terrae]
MRTKVIPAIEAQQAAALAKGKGLPQSIEQKAEASETVREQPLAEEQASGEQAPAEKPFSLAACSQVLRRAAVFRFQQDAGCVLVCFQS